jgi:hypothetical protein
MQTIKRRNHNLESGSTCGLSAPTSLSNTNPLLGAPGVHGGFVPTVPLLPGSPAIDAGDDAACPPIDARGIARPVGAHCDSGAYEAITVTRFVWLPITWR